MYSKIYTAFFIFLVQFSIVFTRFSVTLDDETDLFINWSLVGDQIYFQNGNQLRLLQDKLPKGFPYKDFKNVNGIWAIFFNARSDYFIDPETIISSASFSFNSKSQLIESVSITYCLNGNSSIEIWKDRDFLPFYKIEGSDPTSFEFVTINVPIGLSNHFTVEASTTGTNGFVLIDRIVAFYVETTTTKRPRKTTTASPEINKAKKRSSAENIFLLIIMAIFTLTFKLA